MCIGSKHLHCVGNNIFWESRVTVFSYMWQNYTVGFVRAVRSSHYHVYNQKHCKLRFHNFTQQQWFSHDLTRGHYMISTIAFVLYESPFTSPNVYLFAAFSKKCRCWNLRWRYHTSATSLFKNVRFCCPLKIICHDINIVSSMLEAWKEAHESDTHPRTWYRHLFYWIAWFTSLSLLCHFEGPYLLHESNSVFLKLRVWVYIQDDNWREKEHSNFLVSLLYVIPKMSVVLPLHRPYVLLTISLPLSDRPAKYDPQHPSNTRFNYSL